MTRSIIDICFSETQTINQPSDLFPNFDVSIAALCRSPFFRPPFLSFPQRVFPAKHDDYTRENIFVDYPTLWKFASSRHRRRCMDGSDVSGCASTRDRVRLFGGGTIF